jgi:hypothetical protein
MLIEKNHPNVHVSEELQATLKDIGICGTRGHTAGNAKERVDGLR